MALFQKKAAVHEEELATGPISIKITDPRIRVAVLKRVEDVSELTGKTKYATWIQSALYRNIPAESKEARILESVLITSSFKTDDWPGANGVRGGLYDFFTQNLSGEELENDEYALVMVRYLINLVEKKGLTLMHETADDERFDSWHYLQKHLGFAINFWDLCHLHVPEQIFEIVWEESFDPLPLLRFLEENWKVSTPHMGIWRLTSLIVYSLSNWEEDAYDRESFFKFLEEAYYASKEWEKEISFKREHGFFPAKSHCLSLSEKANLVYPDTWIILNPEDATCKKYPISVYVGERYDSIDVPHGIFFSDNKFNALSEDEKARALRLATQAFNLPDYLEPFFGPIEVNSVGGDAHKAYVMPAREEDWMEVFQLHS